MRGFVVSGVWKTSPRKTAEKWLPSKIRPIPFLDGHFPSSSAFPLPFKNTGQRIQQNDLRHVPRAEVCVLLSHGQGGVPKHPLQRQYVAAVHHVMRGEGMAQDVGHLPIRQLQADSLNPATERVVSRSERQRLFKPTLQPLRNRNRPDFTGLGLVVLDPSLTHLSRQENRGLTPFLQILPHGLSLPK